MTKIFRALSIGMTVLGAVAEAINPDSDEGQNISQREFVRIAIRSGLAAVRAFGKEITNTDENVVDMIKEELAMVDIV